MRVQHGGGIDADLVCAGIQQVAHVLYFAHPAANSERNEHLLGHLLDDAKDDAAVVRTGGDIKESQFVRALLVVTARDLHRITGIAQLDETHAFNDAPCGDIETGNNAFSQHEKLLRMSSAALRGARALAYP